MSADGSYVSVSGVTAQQPDDLLCSSLLQCPVNKPSHEACRMMDTLECPDLLDELFFEAGVDDSLSFIQTVPEADRHPSSIFSQPLRHGKLMESQLSAWLHRESPFKEKAVGADSNGFRLLVCDRSLQDPITVLMSKDSFSKVSKCLNLAPETKASILQILGACGKHLVVTQPDNQKRLQIVIKAYQKGEVGNFMLSLCYNFETAWTDALVCWSATPWRGSRMHDRYFDSGLDHVLRLLVCWKDLWLHPTGIPIALLQSYSRRTEQRCNHLNTSLVELGCELGVNRAGRMYSAREMDMWPSDLDFKSLTIGLHSASNRITFVHQSSQWVVRCTEWMLDLECEIEAHYLPGNPCTPRIQEFLRYRHSVMKGVEIAFESLKARSQAATNVLFNASGQKDSLISQRYNQMAQEQNDLSRKDNLLNIKIASSIKEDSISVSTFTFIAALFLPGTFLTSFFSMALIDWQPGSETPATSGARVAPYFWVFWAIDVPLTASVMLAWWFWYRRQKGSWLQDNAQLLSAQHAAGSTLPQSADLTGHHKVQQPEADSVLHEPEFHFAP